MGHMLAQNTQKHGSLDREHHIGLWFGLQHDLLHHLRSNMSCGHLKCALLGSNDYVQGAPSIVHDGNGAVGATDLLRASHEEVVLVDMTAGPADLAAKVCRV